MIHHMKWYWDSKTRLSADIGNEYVGCIFINSNPLAYVTPSSSLKDIVGKDIGDDYVN